MNPEDNDIVAVVRDLMFSSKITATAKALGKSVRIVRDPSQLQTETSGRHVLIDLNQHGTLEAVIAWKQSNAGKVTGFVSHTDVETIAAAQKAGIDQVLSRGQFTAQLVQILSE